MKYRILLLFTMLHVKHSELILMTLKELIIILLTFQLRPYSDSDRRRVKIINTGMINSSDKSRTRCNHELTVIETG